MVKLVSNRRGVEPIVAAVLLILAAVIAAVALYIWLSGYVTQSTSSIPQSAISEEIRALSVSCNSTAKHAKINITIQNIGMTKVNLTKASIFDYDTGDLVCSNSTIKEVYYDSNKRKWKFRDVKEIAPGDVVKIAFNCTGLISGKVYIVRVFTEKGTEASAVCRAS